ncbi:glutathione peroxidase [bacterium]|nr:glutathione peroxidase [bacterium]
MREFYTYSVTKKDGSKLDLKDFQGKVVLIVNTATGCGFTPQYAPIEEMYKKYHNSGLEILDIPCNQFGQQAPGSDEEIHEFCQIHYNTTFDQMKKSDVNGENELPLFKYLKNVQPFTGFGEGKMADLLRSLLPTIDPDYENNNDIKWNFTKFLVDKEGNVVKRFEPTHDLKEIEELIEKLL